MVGMKKIQTAQKYFFVRFHGGAVLLFQRQIRNDRLTWLGLSRSFCIFFVKMVCET